MTKLWWLLGSSGFAVIAIAVLWFMLFGLPRKLAGLLGAIGAGAVVLAGLLAKARREGAADQRRKQEQADELLRQQAKKDREAIAGLSDDDLDRELREPPAKP